MSNEVVIEVPDVTPAPAVKKEMTVDSLKSEGVSDQEIKLAEKHGFEVMVIWDSEYRWGDKQEIINKCLVFLNKK